MEIGKAREIIRGIHDDDVEVEDKVTALQEELNRESHRGLSRDHLVEAIRWLLEEYIRGEKMDKNSVGYPTAKEKEKESGTNRVPETVERKEGEEA